MRHMILVLFIWTAMLSFIVFFFILPNNKEDFPAEINKPSLFIYDYIVAGVVLELNDKNLRSFKNIRLLFINSECLFVIGTPKNNITNTDSNIVILPLGDIEGTRTVRIAHQRNNIIDFINVIPHKYFIFSDMDEINDLPINKTVFDIDMRNIDRWDVLTFNRNPYYDVWALRYRGFMKNVWDSKNASVIAGNQLHNMRSVLNTTRYLKVVSAFNGFGVYKSLYNTKCRYSGEVQERYQIDNVYDQECEHVSFHQCLYDEGRRIVVSNLVLFGSN